MSDTPNKTNADLNREAMETFRAQFDDDWLIEHTGSNMPVGHTLAVDGHPAPDCFICACWNTEKGIGLTAFVTANGQYKAFIETTGNFRDAGVAERVGKAFAAALKDF